MTTREQDAAIDRIADQFGRAAVAPLRDGTDNVLVQAMIDDIEMGDPVTVTPGGMTRRSTRSEISRVRGYGYR